MGFNHIVCHFDLVSHIWIVSLGPGTAASKVTTPGPIARMDPARAAELTV